MLRTDKAGKRLGLRRKASDVPSGACGTWVIRSGAGHVRWRGSWRPSQQHVGLEPHRREIAGTAGPVCVGRTLCVKQRTERSVRRACANGCGRVGKKGAPAPGATGRPTAVSYCKVFWDMARCAASDMRICDRVSVTTVSELLKRNINEFNDLRQWRTAGWAVGSRKIAVARARTARAMCHILLWAARWFRSRAAVGRQLHEVCFAR